MGELGVKSNLDYWDAQEARGLANNLSTGGSSTISVAQMPSHQHSAIDLRVNWYNSTARGITFPGWTDSANLGVDRKTPYTDKTGGGGAYYPAHISFNVYRRTA